MIVSKKERNMFIPLCHGNIQSFEYNKDSFTVIS